MLSPVPTPTTESRQILIVEDDDLTRSALMRLLKDQGHVVWSAVTSHDGLMLLLNHRPDTVLLDLMLPGIAGEHLLYAARGYGITARVAVLTGIEDEDRLAKLPGLGASCVMRKPIDLHALLTWIAEDLG